jgi:hypothetical protein
MQKCLWCCVALVGAIGIFWAATQGRQCIGTALTGVGHTVFGSAEPMAPCCCGDSAADAGVNWQCRQQARALEMIDIQALNKVLPPVPQVALDEEEPEEALTPPGQALFQAGAGFVAEVCGNAAECPAFMPPCCDDDQEPAATMPYAEDSPVPGSCEKAESQHYDCPGCLWPDALLNTSEGLRQIEYEWEGIWFTDQPSRMTPEGDDCRFSGSCPGCSGTAPKPEQIKPTPLNPMSLQYIRGVRFLKIAIDAKDNPTRSDVDTMECRPSDPNGRELESSKSSRPF